MKIVKLFILGTVLFFASATQAQISVRFNIGTPPSWGPEGYSDVRYYYLPDVQAYYDVQSSMFIYYEGRSWIRRSYLPYRFRDYDLYNGYKVVMKDYHGNTPYMQFDQHRRFYANGNHREQQRTIGQRPGSGNYHNKDYRESNQANRERYSTINKSSNYKMNDDRNYDKRGNEKNNKNKRAKGNKGDNKK